MLPSRSVVLRRLLVRPRISPAFGALSRHRPVRLVSDQPPLNSGNVEKASASHSATALASSRYSPHEEDSKHGIKHGDAVSPATAYFASLDDDDDDDSEPQEESTVKSTSITASRGLFNSGESPLWELNEHYLSQYGISKVSKAIQAASEKDVPNHWTASFPCPISDTLYPAGLLRNDHGDGAVRHVDGRTFYPKKGIASGAAAARALDVIQFQKLGIVEPRLCEEDPSLWNNKDMDSDDPADTKVTTAVTAGIETVASETTASSLQATSDTQDSDHTEPKGTEEPEYVIWDIPKHNGRSPYHRLVEALSSTASTKTDARTSDRSTRPLPLSPDQQLHLAVDNTYAWLRQVNSSKPQIQSPHRLVLPRQETSSTLLMGKILLSAMADAIQGTAETTHETDKAAKNIMDFLWETKNSKPDTDAYAAFLRCLQSNPNPKAVATEAERTFFNMNNGTPTKGKVLPKPNTATTNAMIQLWAQVGGTDGRYGGNLDDEFRPNRESFLCVLSSSAYAPTSKDDKGGFDLQFAKQCVQRMRELAEEDPHNQSLRPDTQVYNAPLRWSGGLECRRTRPYARIIPWDNYQEIFKNGFRTAGDDDDLVEEARSMEAWLEEMIAMDVAPDIETYEAILQAWVRTGTRSGLEHAEALANKLLADAPDSSIRPRLQTFHPILSAWIDSRDRDGATNVQEWVAKLDAAANLIPEVRPDGRVLGSQITAHALHQLVLLDSLDPAKLSDCTDSTRDELLVAAKTCTELLEKQTDYLSMAATRIGNGDNNILEVTAFAHTILVWSNVALVSQAKDQTDFFELALGEMTKAVDSFEALVTTLAKTEAEKRESNQLIASPDAGLQTELELSLQLRHLVVNTHRVYSAFISGLRCLKDTSVSNPNDIDKVQEPLFLRYIYVIERMLRRVGELSEIEAHDLSLKMKSSDKTYMFEADYPHGSESSFRQRSITYADLFRYKLPQELCLPSRGLFLLKVASFLKESPLKQVPAGDIMRLALLIKDVENQSTTSGRSDVEAVVAYLVDFMLQESIQLRRVRSPQQGSLSKFVQESIQLDRVHRPSVSSDDELFVSSQRSAPRQSRRRTGGGTRRRTRSSRKRRGIGMV